MGFHVSIPFQDWTPSKTTRINHAELNDLLLCCEEHGGPDALLECYQVSWLSGPDALLECHQVSWLSGPDAVLGCYQVSWWSGRLSTLWFWTLCLG